MKNLMLIMLLVLLNGTVLHAQSFQTDSAHVEFKSSVPVHSFSGSSQKLVGEVNLDSSIVRFSVDLNSLETGIDKRDRKMRETLETKSFPRAIFTGILSPPFNPTQSDTQDVTVQGSFTLHGVTQDIEVNGTLYLGSQGLVVKAKWTLLLDDYDIEAPGFLFFKVRQEQEILINALLKPVEQ